MPAFFKKVSFGYGAIRAFRNASILVLFSSPVLAEPLVVAAMGDSLTQGYGLEVEDGFVPQMQAWLSDNDVDVRLINAGVSGDTTAGGLSRAAWTLTPDVDAMIVALGANDYLRGIDPATVRSNLEGILDAASNADVDVFVIGLEVGANYGPDYKDEFDAIYPELAAQFGADYFPSWFTGLENDAGQVLNSPEFFQADGIHPNAKGVALIVGAMGPAVADFLSGVESGVE